MERNQPQAPDFGNGRYQGAHGANLHQKSSVMDQTMGFDDDDSGIDVPFAQYIMRHQCVRNDEFDPSQGRRLYDITQYPLIKTNQPEYSDGAGNE